MIKLKHLSQNCCASGHQRAGLIATLIAVCGMSGCAGLTSGNGQRNSLAGVPSVGDWLRSAQQPQAPDQSVTFPPPTVASVSSSLESSSVRLDGSIASDDVLPENPRYVARQYPSNYSAPSNFSGGSGTRGSTAPIGNVPQNFRSNIPSQVISPPTRQFSPSTTGPPLPPGSTVTVPASPPSTPNHYQQPAQTQFQQPIPSSVQYGGVPTPPPGVQYTPNMTPFSPQTVGQPTRVQQRVQSRQFPNVVPGQGTSFPPLATEPVYTPNVRQADLIINGFPARTGRIMFGGAVNSDAGVTGQITVDERNFDIRRWPRSFQQLFAGQAFRGAGETFRLEAAPGSDFDRYTINWATPNLFNYLPFSFSVSGFLYDRNFNDWTEKRLGARTSLGYRITGDLSLSVGFSGQDVRFNSNRTNVQEITDVLTENPSGSFSADHHEMYSGTVSLTHDTRNTPILASGGHYFDISYEKVFGDFDYSRFELEYRQYWELASRADGSGKQTLSYSTQVGYTGSETPIFENFFAGGYATIRGFDFRRAGPLSLSDNPATSADDVHVGGRFQWLNSVEYMFPITADDAFRGVAFVDFGTVERTSKISSDNFRVSPGLGIRVAIPALGPAPLAFDYAIPVSRADGDERSSFSFYMSAVR